MLDYLYIVFQGDIDEEDGAIPDRQQDIKPRFHRAKTQTQTQRKSDITAEGVLEFFNELIETQCCSISFGKQCVPSMV